MRYGWMAAVAALVIAGVSQAAPSYSLSWDFEGSTNLPSGWVASNGYEVRNTDSFNGSAPLTSGNALFLHEVGAAASGDEQQVYFDLPQNTNSWTLKSDIHWSANNLMSSSGIGYSYDNSALKSGWLEGASNGGRDIYWGDPSTPQWPGGQGVKTFSPAFRNSANAIVFPGDGRLTINYNLPSNPGNITLQYQALSYTISATGGNPLVVGTAPLDAGSPRAIDRIYLGGDFMWSQSYFDNVTFTSVPEPATLGLLAVGTLAMLRRRRR